MEGKHPKRKRDKYNPYNIYEVDEQYYISFKDGQGVCHELKIDQALYEAFNSFELEDIKYLNVLSRHIEQSEVWDTTLNVRAFQKPESLEESVMKMLQIEKLHTAIKQLPEIQRRRVILYFFGGLTYEQIAKKEGCTKMPVKRSIDAALVRLKKDLKKFKN